MVGRRWDGLNVRVFTKKTITDFDDFMKQIYTIRKNGYAVDDEESEMNLFCVGTPLLNANHKAIGAISLSTNRMDEEILRELSTELLNQTKRLTYMLSYSIK